MVVRTGLHTSMGSMMRQIVYHTTSDTPRFIKVLAASAESWQLTLLCWLAGMVLTCT